MRTFLKSTSKFFVDQAKAPFEPILHPSTARLLLIGASIVVGFPAYGLVWHYLKPQPFDGPLLRILFGSIGLPLLLPAIYRYPKSKPTAVVASVVFWLACPLAFSWMYFTNGGNYEWFVSVCCMVIIYYHMTDWRLATVGTVLGMAVAFGACSLAYPQHPAIDSNLIGQHLALLSFCWLSALVIGSSTANLRRIEVRRTRETMNIIAHELRTPLSATNLLGQNLVEIARELVSSPLNAAALKTKLEVIGGRIRSNAITMNRRIETLILNSTSPEAEDRATVLIASEIVTDLLAEYQYPLQIEAKDICTEFAQDFSFKGNRSQVTHAISNLLSNAVRALVRRGNTIGPGDVKLSTSVDHVAKRGIFRVIDKGEGIAQDVLEHIFDPFVTSNPEMGLGLGLNYCKEMVNLMGGNISVESSSAAGTCVTLSLPLVKTLQSRG